MYQCDHGVDDDTLVKIQLYDGSPGTVHLIADVAGYILGGTPSTPARWPERHLGRSGRGRVHRRTGFNRACVKCELPKPAAVLSQLLTTATIGAGWSLLAPPLRPVGGLRHRARAGHSSTSVTAGRVSFIFGAP